MKMTKAEREAQIQSAAKRLHLHELVLFDIMSGAQVQKLKVASWQARMFRPTDAEGGILVVSRPPGGPHEMYSVEIALVDDFYTAIYTMRSRDKEALEFRELITKAKLLRDQIAFKPASNAS